jgi:N-acetylneuraminic acid mutarotase
LEEDSESEDDNVMRFLSDVWIFDTILELWHKLADHIPITSFKKKTKHMTTFIPRVGHSSIEHDNCIYLFGGMTYKQKMISSDLYILSLEGKQLFPEYVMKARMPTLQPLIEENRLSNLSMLAPESRSSSH